MSEFDTIHALFTTLDDTIHAPLYYNTHTLTEAPLEWKQALNKTITSQLTFTHDLSKHQTHLIPQFTKPHTHTQNTTKLNT